MNKPGLKTTEFWVTAVIVILQLLVTVGWLDPVDLANASDEIQGIGAVVSGIGAALASGLYAIGRSTVKASENDKSSK